MRLIILAGLVAALPGAAFGQSAESCRTDFQKIMTERQSLVDRINGFAKKKPTAEAACQVFGRLSSTEQKLLTWMTANKDWCQIPDNAIESITTSSKQAGNMRGQACTAAAKQRELNAQARQQQQAQGGQGAPAAPGSGIRLPQGAL